MRGGLDFANGLHQGILDGDGDVASGVALAEGAQRPEVLLFQLARRGADCEFEHSGAGGQVGQADVYSSLETSPDGRVELPGNVCRSQDQHALGIPSHTVHLYQQLSFDAARCLRLSFASGTAQCVDFVDEDDRGLVLSCHVEQLLDQAG